MQTKCEILYMIYLAQCRLLFRCLSLTAPSAPSAGSVHLRLPDTSGLLAPTAGSDTRESSLAGAGLTGANLVSPVCVSSPHLSSPVSLCIFFKEIII